MLKKANRLASKRDFKRVYQRGKYVIGKHIAINYLPNDLKAVRVGVVISRKTSPKATSRNLAKRRLRAAIKPLISKISPGLDIIINIKSLPKDEPSPKGRPSAFKAFSGDLEECLKKSALL